MASTVSSFSVGISADVSEMVSGFNQAAMASQQLVSGMNSVGQSMGAVGGGQATGGIGELARVMELLGLRTEDTSRQISRLAQGNERLLKHIYAAKQATREQTQEIVEQATSVDHLASAKQRLMESISMTAAVDMAMIDESSEMATLERLHAKMRQMKDEGRGESILGDLKQTEADIKRVQEKLRSPDVMLGGGNASLEKELANLLARRQNLQQNLNNLQSKQNTDANEMTVLKAKIAREEERITAAQQRRDEAAAVKEAERLARIEEQRIGDIEKVMDLEQGIMEFQNPKKAAEVRRERHLQKVKNLLDRQVESGDITQQYANGLLEMEDMRFRKQQKITKQQEHSLKVQRNMGYAAQQFGFLLDDIVAGSGTRGVAGAIQASANNITSMLATMRASANVVFWASILVALLQISAQTGLLNKALEKLGMTAGDAVKELKELPKIHDQIAKAQKAHVQHLREMKNLRLNIDLDSAASSIAGLNDQLANAVIEAQKAGSEVQVENLQKAMERESGSLLSTGKAFFGGGGQGAALSDQIARNQVEMMSSHLRGMFSFGLLGPNEEAAAMMTERRGALLKEQRKREAEINSLLDQRTEKQIAHEQARKRALRISELAAVALQKVLHHQRHLNGQVKDRVSDTKAEIQDIQNLLDAGRSEITTAQKRKQIDQERNRLLYDQQQAQQDINQALGRQKQSMQALNDVQEEMRRAEARNASNEERTKIELKMIGLAERDAQLQKEVLDTVTKYEAVGDKLVNNRKALIDLQSRSNQNAESSRSTILSMMGGINEKFAEELRKAERRAQFEREIKELRESQFADQDKINQRVKNFAVLERLEERRNALLERQKKLKEEINALSNVSVQDAVDARSTEAGKLMNQSIIDAMTTKVKDPQVEELKKVNEQLKEVEASIKDIQTVNLKTS